MGEFSRAISTFVLRVGPLAKFELLQDTAEPESGGLAVFRLSAN
jgi:hypothetical protein